MRREPSSAEQLLMKYFALPEVAREYIRACIPASKYVSTIEDLYYDFKNKTLQDTIN